MIKTRNSSILKKIIYMWLDIHKVLTNHISFIKIKKKVHFLRNKPSAIPYVTSYYKRDWGFCLQYNKFKKFKSGVYKAFIDSKFRVAFESR